MKIAFISLGCDKNLADSEKMTAEIIEAGFEITDDAEKAEACVVNTCCFIHDAKQESIETILELAEYKKNGCLKYIVITGCLATRYADEIQESLPEVDAILTSSASDELVNVLSELENRALSDASKDYAAIKITKEADREPLHDSLRLHNDMKPYTYIKIADGCDKHCTYCVIPSIKGRYRSFPMEKILSEAEHAVRLGKKELILVAQETTLYGTDIYGEKSIAKLLRKLDELEGLSWIRLMYCYPEEIDDELVKALKECKKAVKYIDMPIQHISDSVLKRMGRRTNGADIRKKIDMLRKEIPDIVIRTSLITGFPGETEEDHLELLDFIREYKLERVGVFTYSKEEGTPAASLKPQITKKVKEARRKELMLAQQENVFERNERLIGRVMDVLIEGRLLEDDIYVGRTAGDAPDIDGSCFVESQRDIVSGEIIKVRINKASGYDLIASEVI